MWFPLNPPPPAATSVSGMGLELRRLKSLDRVALVVAKIELHCHCFETKTSKQCLAALSVCSVRCAKNKIRQQIRHKE